MYQRWSKGPESKLLQKEAIKRQRERKKGRRKEQSWTTTGYRMPEDPNVEYTRITENIVRKRRIVVEL